MKVKKEIDIYLVRKRNSRIIDLVQGDTGIQLVFNIKDFEIPEGTTATLYVQKPSGKFVYQETGVTISGNTVTVDLDNQAITEHEKVWYQVSLKNGTDEITTFEGLMLVYKSLKDSGASESETVIRAFDELTAKKIDEITSEGNKQISLIEGKFDELIDTNADMLIGIKEDVSNIASKVESNTQSIEKNERKLDFLWKLNHGISYQYETDANSAYQKDVPSGAKCATVDKVGGKTVVWNQLADISKYKGENHNGIAITVSNNRVYVNGTTTAQSFINFGYANLIKGHKYLYNGAPKEFTATSVGYFYIRSSSEYITLFGGKIFEYTNDSDRVGIRAVIQNNITADNLELNFQLFDLTQMFGSGNEPSTVAEFESMFPADYYPYNAGTLMSAHVNEVVEQGKNLFDWNKFATYENWKEDLVTKGSYATSYNNRGFLLDVDKFKTYRISLIFDDVVFPEYLFLCKIKNEESTLISYITTDGIVNTKSTFTVDEGEQVFLRLGKTDSLSNFEKQISKIQYIQLEEGSVSTEYSPYHKTTYPIPEAITSLDGYGWGITDDVCNYVDWENRTFHKKVGEIVLNGTENWSLYGYGGFGLNDVTDCVLGINEVPGNILSNGYMAESYADMSNNVNDNAISLHYAINRIILYNSKYTTVDDWKEYLANAYSSGNPIRIIYELAEEVVTDISDIIGDTFQNPFEVEPGGILTFKNSNGDDYRIPVPNEEEYLIALAEVTA